MLELRPSSSVVSATLGGAEVPISLGPTLRANRSAFCRCSSSSTCSTGIASSMFSVAVGRIARTVKVQSSWFCSKRRRRLCYLLAARPLSCLVSCACILLLCDALIAHALSRLGQLPKHILPRQIPGAQHSSPNGEVCAIPPKPSSRALYHIVVVIVEARRSSLGKVACGVGRRSELSSRSRGRGTSLLDT
jgi:hypothetical protein